MGSIPDLFPVLPGRAVHRKGFNPVFIEAEETEGLAKSIHGAYPTGPAEVIMTLANMTVDQLKVLPLRAIVAFAARCARRVEPLAQLPEGDPREESRRK